MSQAHRLGEAAKSNDIEGLYRLVGEDPSLLEEIDKIPFVATPLHLAAVSGSTHFAMEVLRLKPSFGKKLNPDGYSPMHLALFCKNPQMVCRLMEWDPELIRVKGKEGCTPLHYVAEVDDSELLAVFLVANKKSIEDLNIRKETAVHVAVRKGNLNALKVLLSWIEYTQNTRILNWKDEDDDAALHIAVAASNYEASERKDWPRIWFSKKTHLSSLFVVSGLMIAATYQAVLSPSGGLTSGDSSSTTDGTYRVRGLPAGQVNMGVGLFFLVIMFNAVPFLISTATMILLLPKTKYMFCYWLSLFAISVSYGLSVGIISPTDAKWATTFCAFGFGAFSCIVGLLRLCLGG